VSVNKYSTKPADGQFARALFMGYLVSLHSGNTGLLSWHRSLFPRSN